MCVCACIKNGERETEGSRLHLQCTILLASLPGSPLCTQLAHAIIAHMWGSLGTRLLHTEGREVLHVASSRRERGGERDGERGGGMNLSWLGGR